jgi:Flp pilus assembly protein TadB
MEVRQIAALIIALLTIACVAGAFLYGTRESRAERRGYKRSERSRLRRSKERLLDAERLREENVALD